MSQANLEYKTAMAALEEILTRIDDSDMGIDELASEVERATILLRECRKILMDTEKKIQDTLASFDGDVDSNGD
ncbi:MAG TPA: exodeoxyribonuclease VII small subunit [Fibrobacteraceae bacterium]|jgi:exodeoxyribonuclease VII small subunit|nr:exodeoxyribonuclease VII small subunit [Fibrobacter sp.]HOG69110.1 exodeoxyribonuclease VII small subunit [Fibrobacteraceae bacterium]HPW95281.1 exodeoxyribonuclease VII small subunit [Fibrobacteraceae bacterium]HQB64451.1 exodeoxyribonuclease VII small subunit [Fibrobacteraceae bacterium]